MISAARPENSLQRPDFSEDILDYLRANQGKLVETMRLIFDLTQRVKDRETRKRLRGIILSDLSKLVASKKVIRYRKVTMVARKPRSSQGLLRISEIYT